MAQLGKDTAIMDAEEIQIGYAWLKIKSRTLADLESTRIRIENRQHAYLLKKLGDDCPQRGTKAFTELILDGTHGLLLEAEKSATKRLEALVQEVVGPSMMAFLDLPGIGPKLLARLLGEVGHPVLAFPMHWEEHPDAKGDEPKRTLHADEPYERTVSQLWAYCGLGDPAKVRKAGTSQEDNMAAGNRKAGSFAYQLATSSKRLTGKPDKNGVIRRRSPYRSVYEEKKAFYVDGRPEWTAGHSENAALRYTAKRVLRDIWVASMADLRGQGGELLAA